MGREVCYTERRAGVMAAGGLLGVNLGPLGLSMPGSSPNPLSPASLIPRALPRPHCWALFLMNWST